MKTVYCLFENVKIVDTVKMEAYKKEVFSIVEKYGGEYVVAGDNIQTIEGNWNPSFLVMIKFPSMEHANNWYNSEAYRPLKELRQTSGQFNGIIMEGLPLE
ncbi:DUF1330 domain-containing protein [Sediminicola luteus]|nr:DUF1330 domain-containing protein [Sediminicola luteus]